MENDVIKFNMQLYTNNSSKLMMSLIIKIPRIGAKLPRCEKQVTGQGMVYAPFGEVKRERKDVGKKNN